MKKNHEDNQISRFDRFSRRIINRSSIGSQKKSTSKTSEIISNTIRAIKAMDRKDWNSAISLWSDVIHKSNKKAPVEAYVNLSICYRNAKNFMDAEKLVKGSLTNFKNSLQLRTELAQIASQRGDWNKAIKRWQSIIDEFQLSAPETAYVNLVNACSRMKEFDKADSIAKQGMQWFKYSIAIRAAHASVPMHNNDWNEAVKRWRNILKEFGENLPADIIVKISRSLRSANRLNEASELIDGQIEKKGHLLTLLLEKAEIIAATKNWSEAIKYWESILEEFGDSTAFRDTDRLLCRFNISIVSRLINIKAYQAQIKKYSASKKKKKIAIITSYTKGYDTLKPPEVINEDYDYIVYTDDDQANGYGIFDIRPLPMPELDGPRAIRYVKTHPHIFAKDYEVAIWVDTSIMIVKDLSPLVNSFIESGMAIGSTVHPERNSIYEEYIACLNLLKGDSDEIKKQIDYYRSEGYKSDELSENGILMFLPNDKRTAVAMDEWWNQIMKFSTRDQLSFNYSLSIHGVDWYKLSKPPINARTNPLFVLSPHYINQNVLLELSKLL